MAEAANTPKASPVRPAAANAAIPLFIYGSGGRFYLEPKPGDVSVKNKKMLNLAVANLTDGPLDVVVWFEFPLGGPGQPNRYEFLTFGPGSQTLPILVDQDHKFNNPVLDGVNVIIDGYWVEVGGVVISDPDVKIQR
jgi:hypothetical protein